jgi:regulator of protease activity HflC (stomatin/prohibitin superfamily)
VTGFVEAVKQLLSILHWWVVVSPWEAGVRVRAGKRLKRLAPGIHLRIPFVDQAFVQTTRMRVATIPTQTVTSQDGKTVTVGATVGYCIGDVLRLYQELHDAEETIVNKAAQAIAEVLGTSTTPTARQVGERATELAFAEFVGYGLANIEIRVTDFCVVRGFRLISDHRWSTNERLETAKPR